MCCVGCFPLISLNDTSDVNPLLKLGDLEEAEDVVVEDAPNNYLLCICETWGSSKDRKRQELTIGMVVREAYCSTKSLSDNQNSTIHNILQYVLFCQK